MQASPINFTGRVLNPQDFSGSREVFTEITRAAEKLGNKDIFIRRGCSVEAAVQRGEKIIFDGSIYFIHPKI